MAAGAKIDNYLASDFLRWSCNEGSIGLRAHLPCRASATGAIDRAGTAVIRPAKVRGGAGSYRAGCEDPACRRAADGQDHAADGRRIEIGRLAGDSGQAESAKLGSI